MCKVILSCQASGDQPSTWDLISKRRKKKVLEAALPWLLYSLIYNPLGNGHVVIMCFYLTLPGRGRDRLISFIFSCGFNSLPPTMPRVCICLFNRDSMKTCMSIPWTNQVRPWWELANQPPSPPALSSLHYGEQPFKGRCQIILRCRRGRGGIWIFLDRKNLFKAAEAVGWGRTMWIYGNPLVRKWHGFLWQRAMWPSLFKRMQEERCFRVPRKGETALIIGKCCVPRLISIW